MMAFVIVVGAAVSIALSGSPTSGPEASRSAASTIPTASTSSTASTLPLSTSGTGLLAERIQLERLGIDLPIVEGDAVDAPLNKAAHYPGSGWPGDGTNIYLYGHARAGVLLSLWQVQIGDRIVLTLADGSRREYEVARIVPDAPWNAIGYVDPTPTEQLTLQTSTTEAPTDPRFIVIAFPAP